MSNRLLVRHFLSHFVESDVALDMDRHQILALLASGVITLPLFAAVLMSVQYLLHPLQTPAWTQVTATNDRMIFCATSMLASGIIATLEWDALALTSRDAAVLGALPISHQEIVRAKVAALVTFVAAFVIALNALPAVIHPTVMSANLPLTLAMLALLMVGRALSTMAAGAFGFACVLASRECLYLLVGPHVFKRVSDFCRSALLFSLLLMLLLAPARLSGRTEWVFEENGGPVLQRPVGWFVAMDTLIAGSLLDALPRPELSTWEAEQDDLLVRRYRNARPHMLRRAFDGAGVLFAVLVLSLAMYLWNSRRIHILPIESSGASLFPMTGVIDGLARVLSTRPATRAGLIFLDRAIRRSPAHRMYFTVSVAIGVALWLGMAPVAGEAPSHVRTSQLAAQTLLLTAIIAGFGAVVRTSASPSAKWFFDVADTGNIAAFRRGVRLGMLTVVIAVVSALLPLHAYAWGSWHASMHAVNSVALGWLLVEITCGNVQQPLVSTIAPNDALNTVGAVFLGATVIGVFVVASIERATLASRASSVLFAGAVLSLATWVHHLHERDHRASGDSVAPQPSPIDVSRTT